MSAQKNNKSEFSIMIVEDSPTTIKQYQDEIRDHFEADFFEDARAALNQYKNKNYDLVITDLMLPLKSGEGLIFDIKYSNPQQKIAVISGSPGYLKLKEYDNIQVFEKPVSVYDVINCMLLGKVMPKGPTTVNQRKHPRYNVNLDAKLLMNNRELKIPVQITNVSLGGVFLEADLPNSGEFDQLPLELPLFDKKLVLNLQKRWKKEGVGIGAEFQNLGHSEYSLLELFLESLKSK